MGESYVIAHHHGRERTESHSVGYQVQHGPHIIQEFHSFEA
jgi:hypothetical protein